MENKINIAELLKDCPKGMEMDCLVFEDVTLYKIDTDIENEFPIRIKTKNDYFLDLTKYGTYSNVEEAKCVIFPKGKTTWEGFVPPCKFKDGDVVVDDSGAIFFYRQIHPYYEEPYADFYCGVTSELRGFVIKTGEAQRCGKISSIRYATEEEKRKLFDAIKANGYRWNAETKTLEKLHKFKVGNNIREKDDKSATFTISDIDDSCYYCGDYVICNICDQDNWELVPNRFDITTLKAFDSRVLVRMDNYDLWKPAVFGFVDKISGVFYVLGGNSYSQCIPYDRNEHLRGTTNDCDDFYKTWE